MFEYLNQVFYVTGYLVSLVLVFFAAIGLVAFYPKKSTRGNTASAWLILAIWLGFLSVGVNAFYWRVFGDIALYTGLVSYTDLQYYGRNYMEVSWRGIGAVAIYLHFYARWKAIPFEEQGKWSPLIMGFYPDLHHWAVRMSMRMQVVRTIGRKRKVEKREENGHD